MDTREGDGKIKEKSFMRREVHKRKKKEKSRRQCGGTDNNENEITIQGEPRYNTTYERLYTL